MNQLICFRCQACRARIKAPPQLAGRARSCPGCGSKMTVPHRIPADAEPMLVAVDTGAEHFRVEARW